MSETWRARTRMIHGGHERTPLGETSEALYLTSGFVYERAEDAAARFEGTDPGYQYSRVENPGVRGFERRMALLEGAEDAIATATGMAAVNTALMSHLKAGDRVVSACLLFGSCHWIVTEWLPRFGVEVELVDGTDLDAWAQALARPTTAVFFETPGNPTLELVDIEAVSRLAHQAGATVVVDNVFATPVLQKPLQLGADIVVYSATKHIDGQGRCLGGVILCDAATRQDIIHPVVKNTGPNLSPFNAWVLSKGLETIELRVREHVRNAEQVAAFLEGHPAVKDVLYPGLASHPQHALAQRQMAGPGNLLAFRVRGGFDEAFGVLNAFEVVRVSNNLGDARSLATHPATTTHSRLTAEDRAELGIGDDLIRLSVGLEDPEDLVEDLDQALNRGVPAALRAA